MRIAIVYDCLYPHTIGGAERWYRSLAARLGGQHEVTYLTRLQWEPGRGAGTDFETVPVSPGGELYTASGRRRIGPPLRFGIGVFWHLLRHAGRYDVVHSNSFPYFSLLGAWLALRLRRRGRLVVDWFELWSLEYWREYLGPIGGRIGHAVQHLCAGLPERSFVFSRLHERRLRAAGHRRPITRLTGIYDPPPRGAPRSSGELLAKRPPVVVFAGRHIPEKRVTLLADAVARARQVEPALRAVVFGDGPERGPLAARVRELSLGDAVELRGRAETAAVADGIANAACLLLPSLREGYGLVVVESVALATPAVVVQGSDNAAVELVEDGVNGFVAPSADPDVVADRLLAAVRAGKRLRRSTLEWYRAHADELSIDSSLEAVEAAYRRAPG